MTPQNAQARRVAARFMRRAYDPQDLSWGLDQLRSALGILRDVSTVWSLREGRGLALVDAYPAVSSTLGVIKKVGPALLHQVQLLKQVNKTAVVHKSDYLLPALKTKVNRVFHLEGLDGNGRFQEAQQGLVKAQEVLDNYGIVFEDMVNSHRFSFPLGELGKGHFVVPIAYKDPTGADDPILIKNASLSFSFTELQPGRFEVLAYVS